MGKINDQIRNSAGYLHTDPSKRGYGICYDHHMVFPKDRYCLKCQDSLEKFNKEKIKDPLVYHFIKNLGK